MKNKTKILIYPLILMGVLLMLTSSCKKDDSNNSLVTGTVTDIEGNVYKTVKIGNQWWMSENLKTTQYRNGDSIPNVTDSASWTILNTDAYCNFDNDSNNSVISGRLYNWFAVNDSRKIAPTGWHVPTDTEWTTLVVYLGGEDVAGAKLKETGTNHWETPNIGSTNESGFTALPAGIRFFDGPFNYPNSIVSFWTSTEGENSSAFHWVLSYSDIYISRGRSYYSYGYSIRCIKDN